MSVPSLHDFILAYRKVKTELWWRSEVPSLRLLADYEKDLVANLSRLRSRMKAGFQPDSEFLGSVYYLPKSIERIQKKDDAIHFRELCDRRSSNKEEGSAFEMELRQIAVPSIDFQVLSVLWAMGEGGNIDARRAASSRANVLRRNFVPEAEGQFPDVETTLRGPVNPHYPGLYRTYFNAYKNWRNDGLKVARNALENGQRVFALTMDLRRYYHQIDAVCLRGTLGTRTVAKALERSMIAWQKRFGEPDEPGVATRAQPIKRGIPVGLIASGLIANLLLDPLDQYMSPYFRGELHAVRAVGAELFDVVAQAQLQVLSADPSAEAPRAKAEAPVARRRNMTALPEADPALAGLRQKFEELHPAERNAHRLRIALVPRLRDQTLDTVRTIECKV